jgi:hypothetical protein
MQWKFSLLQTQVLFCKYRLDSNEQERHAFSSADWHDPHL